MKKLLTLTFTLCALGLHGAFAQAVSYSITGTNSSAGPLAPSFANLNLTASDLTLGPGLVVPSGSGNAQNSFGGSGWDDGSSASTAAAAGNYISFTLTVNSGYTASFTSFDAYNVRHSGTGPTEGQWQFSLNGTSYTSIGSSFNLGSGTSSSGNAMPEIDLSGITALQNIAGGTTVTFRFLAWGASAVGGTGYLNGQGTDGGAFTVQGTTTPAAIPEPGTLALLGLGMGFGLWSVRRRFQRAA